MPSPDNKALTRRWFEEVWNKRREEAIEEMLGPHGIAHGLAESGEDLPGPAEFRRFYRQFRSGFPDIRIKVDQVIGEGDTTAVRFTAYGSHTGDGLGIKATGRPVREAWNEFDAAGLMRQLAAPAAAQPIKLRA